MGEKLRRKSELLMTENAHQQRGTIDVFQVADLLVSHAVNNHGAQIDIIAYYGSYAQGVAKETSDLDIFYTPAEGHSPPVGRTFLVAGRLFDFWAIPWETLQGFAVGQIRGWSFAPAIVHHAKLLYARTEEQEVRLAALKQHVLDLQAPAARPQMIRRAVGHFQHVLAHLGNLRLAIALGDFASVRHAGWKVILAAWECLSLANQVFSDRGWGNILEQIPRLPVRPEKLAEQIVTISTSHDPNQIASAADALALSTRQILRDCQASLPAQQTAATLFDSSYPEIHDGLGKVLSACERQQPVAASAGAWFAQSDLSLMLNELESGADFSEFNLYAEFAHLYRQLGFPDLMQATSGDLHTLSEQTRLLDQRLRRWLHDHSVDLCEFETQEQFEQSMLPVD